jgi:NAD(P)-dependent dehydrogenase (short-subunit alcohol dehydrogenase family)
MQGKIVLITGATSGIGKETARAFARLGAITVLVGRDRQKTAETVHEIQAESGNPQVGYLVANLSSQAEVRRLASEFLEHSRHLDVLVNNAGALFATHQVSADGIEMTLALNHLAPFLLTHLLTDALYASPAGKVINVASEMHRSYHLDFEDMQLERGYSAWRAYGLSKLANIYFTYALAASFDGFPLTANCLHPGFVATNFGRSNGGLLDPMVHVAQLAAISPQISAQAIVHLATSPELAGVNAGYFNLMRQEPSSDISYDMNIARQLWDASLALTGLV